MKEWALEMTSGVGDIIKRVKVAYGSVISKYMKWDTLSLRGCIGDLTK